MTVYLKYNANTCTHVPVKNLTKIPEPVNPLYMKWCNRPLQIYGFGTVPFTGWCPNIVGNSSSLELMRTTYRLVNEIILSFIEPTGEGL